MTPSEHQSPSSSIKTCPECSVQYSGETHCCPMAKSPSIDQPCGWLDARLDDHDRRLSALEQRQRGDGERHCVQGDPATRGALGRDTPTAVAPSPASQGEAQAEKLSDNEEIEFHGLFMALFQKRYAGQKAQAEWVSCVAFVERLLAARVAALQASLDQLHGRKFSDRAYTALVSRAETAEAQVSALEARLAEAESRVDRFAAAFTSLCVAVVPREFVYGGDIADTAARAVEHAKALESELARVRPLIAAIDAEIERNEFCGVCSSEVCEMEVCEAWRSYRAAAAKQNTAVELRTRVERFCSLSDVEKPESEIAWESRDVREWFIVEPTADGVPGRVFAQCSIPDEAEMFSSMLNAWPALLAYTRALEKECAAAAEEIAAWRNLMTTGKYGQDAAAHDRVHDARIAYDTARVDTREL